ncbi:nephrin [Patella vulgata]|uniref:nephrin n=1 Tax=Patella vulgata TaxID=6465 RepID=UPI0024A9A7BE|nr:nephrin [Patella vulgata]
MPNFQYKQSLTLLVKCSPRQDTRVITTSIVGGNIRDIVQLVSDVISYPPPTFTWYYNNITTGDVEPIYNDDVFKQIDTSISINTYRSTLTINITSNIFYTSYTVNVSNNIGYTEIEYQVTALSKPDVPSNINSLPPSHDSICIIWTPGFNGGGQQEFIVQHSVDNKTWTSSTPLPESKPDYCIKNLQADTTYYIRVIARNKYDDSQPVYLISSDGSSTIQTLARVDSSPPTVPPDSNTGLIAGLVVTVVIIIFMAVVVVILVRKIKQRTGKDESSTYAGLDLETRTATGVDDTTYQGLQHYVNLQPSSTDIVNTQNNQNYDSLQQIEPTTVYDSLNTVDSSLNTVEDRTRTDNSTTTFANINRDEKSAYVNLGIQSNI